MLPVKSMLGQSNFPLRFNQMWGTQEIVSLTANTPEGLLLPHIGGRLMTTEFPDQDLAMTVTVGTTGNNMQEVYMLVRPPGSTDEPAQTVGVLLMTGMMLDFILPVGHEVRAMTAAGNVQVGLIGWMPLV